MVIVKASTHEVVVSGISMEGKTRKFGVCGILKRMTFLKSDMDVIETIVDFAAAEERSCVECGDLAYQNHIINETYGWPWEGKHVLVNALCGITPRCKLCVNLMQKDIDAEVRRHRELQYAKSINKTTKNKNP